MGDLFKERCLTRVGAEEFVEELFGTAPVMRSTRANELVTCERQAPWLADSSSHVTHVCCAIVVSRWRTGESCSWESLLRDSQEGVVAERTDGHCASRPQGRCVPELSGMGT